MGSRYARPKISFDEDWYKQVDRYVTERDKGLLELIYEKNILKREEIQQYYPVFKSVCVLNRRLKRLYDLHLIDKYYLPNTGEGSSQQYICLDYGGLIVLGINLTQYVKPIQIEKGRRNLVS
jgi:hypothetical protein